MLEGHHLAEESLESRESIPREHSALLRALGHGICDEACEQEE